MNTATNVKDLTRFLLCCLWLSATPALAAPDTQLDAKPTTQPVAVRCAVIGGMMETSFWPALAERFEKQTGVRVEVVASGPKEELDDAVRRGGVDLVVMHASDTILNLVADGFAADARPWARNDMLIVGPPDDPAGIKGETDAARALGKIAKARANFVVHASAGAQEVLRALLNDGEVELGPEHTTALFDDRQRRVLQVAAQKRAYTLVGRIPFRNGKLPNDGLAVMVQGDPRLRRPYLLATANPSRFPAAHLPEARRLAAFLRSPETQQWIAAFGKGQLDDQPLFFPVTVPGPATRPAGTILAVGGEVPHPLNLTAPALAAMPRRQVKVKDAKGTEVTYEGVLLGDVLKEAGVALGGHRLPGEGLSLCVVAEGADGYRVTLAMAELADEFAKDAKGAVLLADRKDGRPLDGAEGPIRLVVPGDGRAGRRVRQVASVRVVRPPE